MRYQYVAESQFRGSLSTLGASTLARYRWREDMSDPRIGTDESC